ncbi:hypothetical protein FACUT_10759 [Fusarium acutatum]|uniref:WSC domain-containing protein n=1 Tax=Fusarium acutatum TaxID=78861 RepID=A0A8H4NFB8_9HYPO|nr:hypothetical protein FACUT_10759 [Fusarium acutatum]
MVHFIKTAFLFLSGLGLTEGFMNDPGNRPPLAGKRTHRGCYRGLSDTAGPVVKVKGDKTKNTWTACGQYCLAKGKPMALVQGADCYCSETIPNQRKSVGGFGHYCMDPCPGKPTDLVACGSERFGSYSAINTGLKSELVPDQDPLPYDPIQDCLSCTFKLPGDAVFPGEASGVQSCRDACRYLKSKTLMMYDKYVYDVSEPQKPEPNATTPQDATSPIDTQVAKTTAQTSGRSVEEFIEDVETEVQLQLLILEGVVWEIFAWVGRVMTKLVTPREGHEDDDRELDLQ